MTRVTAATRLLLILCLAASAVQGLVVQTHVHAAPTAGVAHAPVADALPGTLECLLCDIAGHTPAAGPPPAGGATALLSLLSTALLPPTAVAPPASPGHHWLGRGPPTL